MYHYPRRIYTDRLWCYLRQGADTRLTMVRPAQWLVQMTYPLGRQDRVRDLL